VSSIETNNIEVYRLQKVGICIKYNEEDKYRENNWMKMQIEESDQRNEKWEAPWK